MTTPSLFPPETTREQLFALYPQLAKRVASLRTILQNEGEIPKEQVREWVKEVRSVYSDFMTLNELTRDYLLSNLIQEPPHEPPSLP